MSRNLLAEETSPYLLQHKDNPVHWRPWSEPALVEAKRLDRPILLSIGYAACHWCHVMAHESFENEIIAGLMNERFVNIKVDREERPDIDALYQAALAMLGEQGGWPLTMFLTPDGDPFWGGTYFPPTARYGRPGFPDVLVQIAQVYREQKEKVAKNVEALRQGLAKLGAPQPGQGLTPTMLDDAAMMALRLVDPIRGRAQVPAAGVLSAAVAGLQTHPSTDVPGGRDPHLGRSVPRRHLRPSRRRVRALRHRCRVAGAALREDALRQRFADRTPDGSVARHPKRAVCAAHPRNGGVGDG